MAAALVDRPHLDMLLAEYDGDRDLLRAVIAAYIGELDGRVAAIDAAGASGDPTALANAAHALKSASVTIGAAAIGEAAKEVELIGKEGRVSGAGPVISRMRTLCRSTVEELRAW